jgi:hypothetical protein
MNHVRAPPPQIESNRRQKGSSICFGKMGLLEKAIGSGAGRILLIIVVIIAN